MHIAHRVFVVNGFTFSKQPKIENKEKIKQLPY